MGLGYILFGSGDHRSDFRVCRHCRNSDLDSADFVFFIRDRLCFNFFLGPQTQGLSTGRHYPFHLTRSVINTLEELENYPAVFLLTQTIY
ncbi:hypothetical protein SBDP1_230037 [Syntrophobacter sp. SbD1]|nr:hypothetical protein SBDP1_230037 [Syntrophobacter sp. SbD1]